MQRSGCQLSLAEFAAYPLNHVTKSIRAAQTRVNNSMWTQAILALEHYYLHTSSENRPAKSIEDYLPYSIEKNAEANNTVFRVLSRRERKQVQKLLNDFAFSPKTHASIVAAGWVDI